MALVVAARMANGKVFDVAVAAFAQWLDVFKGCIVCFDMLSAYPARYLAMQLAGNGFVDF